MSRTTLVSCLVCGVSIGWLTGLSVSPVVQSVLASLLTIVTALVAAAAGLNHEMFKNIPVFNPMPVVALALGVALGAPAGIVVRDHKWLAPVEQRGNPAAAKSSASVPFIGGLTSESLSATECQDLKAADKKFLKERLLESKNESVKTIVRELESPQALEALLAQLCK